MEPMTKGEAERIADPTGIQHPDDQAPASGRGRAVTIAAWVVICFLLGLALAYPTPGP